MSNDLRNFLTIPYDQLEELNLNAKEQRQKEARIAEVRLVEVRADEVRFAELNGST